MADEPKRHTPHKKQEPVCSILRRKDLLLLGIGGLIDFWFVRHAESETNANREQYRKIYVGCNNWSELTAKGIEQSKTLGKHLKGMEFADYLSSPAIRAQQTARYCLNELGYSFPLYRVIKGLREIDQGSLEGKIKNDSGPKNKKFWTYVPKGGKESQNSLFHRVRSRLEKEVLWPYLKNERVHRKILIFSHENAIGCFRAGALNLDKEEAYGMGLKNTGINILQCNYELRYNVKDNKLELECEWTEIEKCHEPHLKD